MSCQLNLLAFFQDVRSVKRYLFPDQVEDHKKEDKFEGWDDSDWSWKDNDQEADNKESVLLSWLQDCHVSLSPTGDLLVLAKDDRIVHLGQKWDSQDEDIQTKYDKLFEGSITQEDSEKITCVLCLPLASQKRSTHGGPDWTCVIVGFSSGYVRIYTENGTLLLSQIFSEECIKRIKCQTYAPARHEGDGERLEELTILYSKSLVTIDGFSFFQSLKACKNQVARAAASGSELLQPPPLAYKKWGLVEQEQIMDYTPCGIVVTNPFDQMRVDCMNIGCNAGYKPNIPLSYLYLTTGVGPYASFFYTFHGSAQPLLSDVAHAVASKLKSAILSAASGWLGLGRNTPDNTRDKKRPKIEPATPLAARFGIYDKRRSGETVLPSPDGHLAATTDSFGRVILFDVRRGIAVRMWKGYRDAQVGWMEAKEEPLQENEPSSNSFFSSSTPAPLRRAYFLIIYAPRRGILEIWAMQHGPRVAAFSVSKWCRLLCLDYGIMGLNNVTCRDVKVQIHSVYLIDLDGSIKTISVPFHLALSDKNSKRARDMHLLKQLKILLKENIIESGALQSDVIETLLDIKMASIRQQGLERLLHTKYLSAGFLQSVINAVSQQMETLMSQQEESNVECIDFESRMLFQFCRFHQLLIGTYASLNKLAPSSPDELIGNTSQTDHNETVTAELLQLSSKEAESVFSKIKKYLALVEGESHVSFKSDLTLSIVDFVSCFECRVQKIEGEDNEPVETTASSLTALVLPGLSDVKKTKLANFIFRTGLHGTISEDYMQLLRDSGIPPNDLMTCSFLSYLLICVYKRQPELVDCAENLLLHLGLSSDRRTLQEIPALHSLVLRIKTLGGAESSDWWASYKESCTQSQSICSALVLAMIGRRVAKDQQSDSIAESEDGNQSSWEILSMDHQQWHNVVMQLEDLLVVQCLLKMKPGHEALSKSPTNPEPISISLKRVLDGGKGIIPEFVAKWISGHGIPPYLLCPVEEEVHSPKGLDSSSTSAAQYERQASQQMQQTKQISFQRSKSLSLSCSPLIAQLQDVQHRFPHTLSSDVLMANCSWEFMVIWNRDPEVIYPLDQAMAYLKCIQNASLQHGLAMMIWQMFAVKKLSSTALLTEKVGKAPKDRLCRKDVGLSEVSLEKFLGRTVELLEIIIQASIDSHEVPVFKVEDLWQTVQGPTSLVELAIEQKEANIELVEHHYALCVILHAAFVFSLKAVKPLSMFDTKGKNAFFKPLHSVPLLSYRVVDESIITARTQFLFRVITQAVIALGDQSTSTSSSSTPSIATILQLRGATYRRWPRLMQKLAESFGLSSDLLLRHRVVELYSSGLDGLAEEVVSGVSDHESMGVDLLMIAGQRLSHFVFACEPPSCYDRLAVCSTNMSTWLKTMDHSLLRCPNPPLHSTESLLRQVVHQLPEDHAEYGLALELMDLTHSLKRL